ncbi:MAG TPA: redoxin domain-containing protein [Pirellulales bacterium]|jgi:thiol-disulfide isomerase/thioredoxin
MLRTPLCWVFALLVVGQSSAWAADASNDAKPAEKATPLAIGEQAPDFTFKDLRFASHTLKDLGQKKAYVITFSSLDCPVAKRYMPRIVELGKEYSNKDVQFVVINVAPNDSMVEVSYQGIQLDAGFPFCKDFDGTVAPALGVTRTPQVVVLDGERKLRYRGRVDSQFSVNGLKPNTGREDLKMAIEDVLAGRPVDVAETTVEGCPITVAKIPAPEKPVTFGNHVAAILQKNCEECHRPGAEAPFSLVTYEDAVNHADVIAEVVKEQRMPPEYASRQHGDFVNLRGMPADERTLVAQWVAGGCQQGDLSKVPVAKKWPDGKWLIDGPDLVIKMKEPAEIPATGFIPYKYVLLPYTFKQDTWITGCQILPENKAALHHCNLAAIDPLKGKYSDAQFITGQVPGGIPMELDEGVGFKIAKGSVLVMQIHYVTTGEKTTDQSSLGFTFAKGKIDKQLKHFRGHNGTFAIPPGDGAHLVEAKRTFAEDSTLVGFFSHMHLRGKDMMFDAKYPDGKTERLLAIPNYDFNWQVSYVWRPHAKKFPKGTEIDVTAHFDNSAFNPYNPDPTATVKEGDQTFEEMMYGFVFYTEDHENLNLTIDPKTGYEVKPGKEARNKAAADGQAGQ